MTLLNWIPAISTTALLGAAGWFSRQLIITRLHASVRHEFNEQLERLRGDIRVSEERFKADLRAKEAEIDSLRSGALTAMVSRQVTLDKRRMEAIDQLWSAVVALAPAKGAVSMMAVVKFEAAAEGAAKEPRLRQLFDSIGGNADLSKLELSGAQKARPFLTPMAWALYSALIAVVAQALLRISILRSGVDPKGLTDDDALPKLLKSVLPHLSDYIDRFGSLANPFILEQLEAKLLDELHNVAAGVESDRASLERAAEILKHANELTSKIDAPN